MLDIKSLFGWLIVVAAFLSPSLEAAETEKLLYEACKDYFDAERIEKSLQSTIQNGDKPSADLIYRVTRARQFCPVFAKGFFVGQIKGSLYCIPSSVETESMMKIYINYIESHKSDLSLPFGVGFAKSMHDSFPCKK